MESLLQPQHYHFPTGNVEQRFVLEQSPTDIDGKLSWRRVVPRCLNCRDVMSWESFVFMMLHLNEQVCEACLVGALSPAMATHALS